MKIPFGPKVPNELEREQLSKLGFDLKNMEKVGAWYYLNIPKSPRFTCIKVTPDSGRERYRICYNDTRVIFINLCTERPDGYLYFNILAPAIETALAKNADITEEEARTRSVQTAYQTRLADRLNQLVDIVFNGGAASGFASEIEVHCEHLRKLQTENQVEHDALVAKNECYKELLELFPEWRDSNALQERWTYPHYSAECLQRR